MRWSGRPIIYQAARAHEFTIIISPHRALRPRNPPARMVRSAVLLFGDVCGMILGVDALGFFWVVTRTASRTLRNHRVSQPTSAHGTFRGPFVWRRLRNDRWGRMHWVFWDGHEDRFTNPTEPQCIEEHPARMEGQCDFVYRFQDCGRTTSCTRPSFSKSRIVSQLTSNSHHLWPWAAARWSA